MFYDEQFEIIGVSVPSNVSEQPMSSDETLLGATSRMNAARKQFPNAHYWVGIEGGLEREGKSYTCFGWIVVSNDTFTSTCRTANFPIPSRVAELVDQGMELGAADDIVFGRTNSKQDNGTIGLLTRNLIDRAGLHEHAAIIALIPFVNEHLYQIARP